MARNHLQIISSLRSEEDLKCPFILLLAHLSYMKLNIFTCILFCQIVFFGIDNIHAMRDSFARLRDYLDTHGAASSDGMSSFLVSPAILLRYSYLPNGDLSGDWYLRLYCMDS